MNAEVNESIVCLQSDFGAIGTSRSEDWPTGSQMQVLKEKANRFLRSLENQKLEDREKRRRKITNNLRRLIQERKRGKSGTEKFVLILEKAKKLTEKLKQRKSAKAIIPHSREPQQKPKVKQGYYGKLKKIVRSKITKARGRQREKTQADRDGPGMDKQPLLSDRVQFSEPNLPGKSAKNFSHHQNSTVAFAKTNQIFRELQNRQSFLLYHVEQEVQVKKHKLKPKSTLETETSPSSIQKFIHLR